MRRLIVVSATMALSLASGAALAVDDQEPRAGAFSHAGELAEPRGLHAAILQPDGRVLIVGGNGGDYTGTQTGAPTEVWDPATNSFTTIGPVIAEPDEVLVPLTTGRVLVLGQGPPEIRDPLSGEAMPVEGLLRERHDPTAVLLDDGRVLIIGGTGPDERGRWRILRSAEVWDPSTDTSSWTGGLPRGLRTGTFTATLLPDGRVLIVGGAGDDDRAKADAYVWDQESESFRPTGKLDARRYDHTATLLPDGRVLIVGGIGEDRAGFGRGLISAEIWDPTTESHSPAGSLVARRYDHTATLLPDGRVLIIGGDAVTYANTALMWAEVWDPASETFTKSEVLERTHHSATLLSDGRVLLVGGMASEKWHPSAQIWDSEAIPSTADGSPSPTAIRREMREWLSTDLRCRPYERSEVDNDPFAYGALAALVCKPKKPGDYPGVDYVTVFRFGDAQSLGKYWQYRQTQNPDMEWRRTACIDGKKGYGSWGHGEHFCYVSKSSGRALVRWTDELTNTYGVLDAKDRDLARLWEAWGQLGPRWPRPVEV